MRRQLTFKEIFFLSFGGQSPLLSLLTYGAVALSLGGYLAPIILLIATLIVLANGMVVQRLSRRFTSAGGYYTYALHLLSERMGFQTGWMYLFYSVLFGSAYVLGAVYVINYVLGIPTIAVALAISLPASAFLILGIRPSAKYALFSGMIEIGVMLAFFGTSVYLAHGTFYVPTAPPSDIGAGRFALAILFAMGIPTGFGAIAPMSGEVVNAAKVVGRAAVAVIVSGGVFAALVVYGMVDLLVYKNVPIATSGLAILSIVTDYFAGYSKYFVAAFLLGALSDGVLAMLSFSTATSRTIYKMGTDGTLPSSFSRLSRGQPMAANVLTAAVVLGVCITALLSTTAATAFIALGTVSVLGGLFIHLAANFSLLRVGIRHARRLLGKGAELYGALRGAALELLLSLAAATITALELVFSATSTSLVYVTIFLTWIVVGYILMDVREIVFRTPFLHSPEGVGRMDELNVMQVRSALPDVTVGLEDTVRSAVDRCLQTDSAGAVVLNGQRPVAVFLLRDAMMLGDSEMSIKVRWGPLSSLVRVNENTRVPKIAELFRNTDAPIIAIVDRDGNFKGTVQEREIVRRFMAPSDGGGSEVRRSVDST